MARTNIIWFAGIMLLAVAVLFLSGILTALLIPQMIALWQWFGFEVSEPNLWDVYVPLVSLMIMPIVLVIFAVLVRKPK